MLILFLFTLWISDPLAVEMIEEGLIRGEEVVDFPSTLPYFNIRLSSGAAKLLTDNHLLSTRFCFKGDTLNRFWINPLFNRTFSNNILVRLSPFLLAGKDPAYRLSEWKGGVKGDFEEAGLVYNLGPLFLSLGRMRMRWGVTDCNLILAGRNYPFDLLGFRYEKRPILFAYFHGQLERLTAPSPVLGDSLLSRYLVGHRLETRICRKIHFGFTETCIYATPGGIDFSYLNPLLLYYEVIWNRPSWSGSDDNIVWSLDLRFDLPPTIYLELMIDDYQYEPPPDKETNEIGFTFGTKVPISRYTINIEYTRLNNFCYNVQKSYLRYVYRNYPLGYYHGPDVEDLKLSLKYCFLPIVFDLKGGRHRKGEGRYDDPWPALFPSDCFLTGVVEDDYNFELGLKIYRRYFYLGFTGGLHWLSNYRHQNGKDKVLATFSTNLLFNLN